MLRVVSTTLRICWAYRQHNIRLAIAAQVLVAAGTVILFVVNLFFTQRLVRARHPRIGWTAPFKVFIPPLMIGLSVLGIIMIITVIVQSFYTVNPNTQRIDRDVQWAVSCWFTFTAFIPLPIVAAMFLISPRQTHIDRFGSGRFGTKVMILLFSSALLTLGAGFRCGTGFLPAMPTRAPAPWYYSKACFYCFDFLMELLVVVVYALFRVDRRFFVLDGASGPGEYSGHIAAAEKPVPEAHSPLQIIQTLSSVDRRAFSHSNKVTHPSTN